MAEDDAGVAQRRRGRVQRRHAAGRALRDVDDDDAALLDGGADAGRQDAVGARGRVARAEGLEDEAAEAWDAQHAVDHLGFDAREDAQAGDVRGVEGVHDFKTRDGRGAADEGPVHLGTQGGDLGERLHVGGSEGGEGGGGDFGGAVTAIQSVVEEEAYLGDGEGPRDDEGAEQVVDGVGLQGEDGGLRAGEDDRLAEVGEHEGEGGAGVCEAVCAMEDDEAVEEGVVVLDCACYLGPACGGD